MQSDLVSKGEGPGPFGTEIDIFEYFNELGADTLTLALHWVYGSNQKTSGRLDSYLRGLHSGFHTLALEWTPLKYAFYIDGMKFQERSQGVSHVDEYLILSMEIPDTMEAMRLAFPTDTFWIDSVKVYQRADFQSK